MFADDAFVSSGNAIDKFIPTIGADITPFPGAEKANRSIVLGRTAAVFTPGALGSYITDNNNVKSNITVARFDGVVPFDRTIMLSYISVYVRMLMLTGGSTFSALGTSYVDGSVGNAVNNNPHCYVATSVNAGINSYLGSDNNSAKTFDGPVWFWARFSNELSAGQISAIYAELRKYYTFLT
jgi:hypothetical protein